MLKRYDKIYSPALGRDIEVTSFGHYGAPIIAFPSGGGRYFDFEGNGMIEPIAHLIDGGVIKVYCPDGVDNESWLNQWIEPHWRAVRHNAYQDFIVNNLVPAIRFDCRDENIRIGLVGCSLGAYHAANFALKFPHIFHYGLCMSGRYDLETILGEANGSPEVYFNNPVAYVSNLHGGALDFTRQTHLALVCGQGAWEGKCLTETHRLADLLAQKGISHERDIWGFDVEHHWFWWRRQVAYHLSKTFS
jgi:esterase/lipase superfamily enzyme